MKNISKREISHLAWREWKYAKTMAGDTSVELMATDRPPSGWVAVELGFGFAEGPSLMFSAHQWEEKKIKEARDQQDKESRTRSGVIGKKKRETADDRAKVKAILAKD